ncbi:hypothetical protein CLOM_g18072 [Closterium sp. NIES-68]|nr:hypothetical protein CLOM_g18072 [Closterium sp. NIES-68]GJP65546.1 hypothetical protein CLOP_g22424 [Closterium sp. NIES-67]
MAPAVAGGARAKRRQAAGAAPVVASEATTTTAVAVSATPMPLSQLSGNVAIDTRDGHMVQQPSQVSVDLSKLHTSALKRYRRHFKLAEVGPNSSKEQLLSAVGRHFMAQQLDELQVLAGFLQAAKRLKVAH